jgi:TonB-linked SusC/RagA family outer membrane protein
LYIVFCIQNTVFLMQINIQSNLFRMKRRKSILIVFFALLSLWATSQTRTITGKVLDDQQSPLPGVSIVIAGTTSGTVTDLDGNFSLPNVRTTDKLKISFIGMKEQTIDPGTRNSIMVTLLPDLVGLDEVIVVGYGTQKKIDVIGSVSTIKTDELLTVPTPTVAQAISGRTSGVFVKTKNAQPGEYGGISYNIRGFGEALLIIDGMPATNEEFLLLDPNDIEEFNVLKDAATAAVYGARAGNGVILVKTKRGKVAEPQFSYNGNYGLQKMTMIPHAVNSSQNAGFENVALENAGLAPQWSQETIDKFKANNDPNYPNTDWWDLTLRDFAPQTQHNLSVRGGTDRVKYFISGGYYYQESLYESNDLKNKKYNLRSNLDVKLTDRMDVGLDLTFLENDYIGPSWDMAQQNNHLGIMMLLYRSRPQYPAEYPDKTKYSAMGNDDLNPVSATRIDHVGYYKWNKFTGDVKFSVSYKLPLGIIAKAIYNYKRDFRREKRKELLAPAYWFDYDAQGNIRYNNHRNFNSYNWLYEKNTSSSAFNQQYFLTWNKEIGDHKINALGVYEYLSSEGDWFDAQRIRYEFDLDYLFAGPEKDKSNNGRGWQDGRVGQIFSLDYNYKEKYLFGFNMRRDGSPKFPEDTRWGIFPSISAGWRISEEAFLKDKMPFISNLKLRASWGKLGFDQTGNFQYLSTYTIMPTQLMIDGAVRSGLNADNIPNLNITWENMTTSNLGIDFGILGNSITGSFDVFYRLRSKVLGNRQVSLPDVVGAILPKENIEEYSNRGAELSLDYTKKIGEFNVSVGGNISYSRQRVESIDQPAYASEEERRRNDRIGKWSDLIWGYKADGVFTTQEEIDNWANIDGKGNATVNVGDIKLIDYNGDGVINSYDNVIIGRGTSPDIIFGLYSNLSWKGIDFSMLWQGAGLYDIHYGKSADFNNPFQGGNAPFLEMYKYSYTPENKWGVPANLDSHPIFPRYYWPSYTTHNKNANSSFWLKDGTYIRLKSVELGYNLPKTAIKRFGFDNCKVYLSGYNVLTFSALDFFDPELEKDNSNDQPLIHPPMATYSIGLLLDF